MAVSHLHGIYPPILTPLTSDERVDHASLRRLVDFLIAGGVHGIWGMGTTGEFAALPEDERARGLQTIVDQVAGRVPVIANVGDSSTGLALRHARHAADAGADALALTPPHYYLNSMDEMLGHFRTMKQAFPDLPLFIYNIPPTVKVKMTVSTTLQLATEGTASGIKDSQNDLNWFRTLVMAVEATDLGERFRMFLGTRSLIDAGVAIGAHGAIPAVSNVAPAACVETYEAARRGDYASARRTQEHVLRYEALADVARGGCAEAARFSSMKHVLRVWGVVADPTITRPLRPLTEAEVAEMRKELDLLPIGTSLTQELALPA